MSPNALVQERIARLEPKWLRSLHYGILKHQLYVQCHSPAAYRWPNLECLDLVLAHDDECCEYHVNSKRPQGRYLQSPHRTTSKHVVTFRTVLLAPVVVAGETAETQGEKEAEEAVEEEVDREQDEGVLVGHCFPAAKRRPKPG